VEVVRVIVVTGPLFSVKIWKIVLRSCGLAVLRSCGPALSCPEIGLHKL